MNKRKARRQKRIMSDAKKYGLTLRDFQVDTVARYLGRHEKHEADNKIGVEFEHLILDGRSLEAVSYFGKAGVEETLAKMQSKGWHGEHENDYLLALERDGTRITLEPGARSPIRAEHQASKDDHRDRNRISTVSR